jgi:adenosylhomocysteine nucleosidase
MKVAAVTGLAAEAKLARRAGLAALPSGGVSLQTTAIAESLLREGAEALVSFGIAGALAPSLAPGSLLVPRTVIDETGARYAVDTAWRTRLIDALRRAGLRFDEGDLLGARDAAASPARKAELLRAIGAVAIDLESHLVAHVAARAGRPFLVLRAVADGATRPLPDAAVHGLAPSGSPALGRVLLSVARDPRQIPALIRLAGDTRRALDALGSALRAVSLEEAAP